MYRIENLSLEKFNNQDTLIAKQEEITLLKAQAEELVKEAQKQANIIIEEAKSQAKEILDKAKSEAEDYKKEAFQRGFAEGEDKAKREIEERYNLIFENELLQLKRIIEVFRNSYQETIKQAEQALVKLALDIAEKIIKEEATKNKEIVLRMVKEGLCRVLDRAKLVLHIHPEELNFVEKNKQKLLATLEGIEDFEIRQDTRVDIGGCIIETESGSVEVRLDKQIKEIRKALTGEDREFNVSHNS